MARRGSRVACAQSDITKACFFGDSVLASGLIVERQFESTVEMDGVVSSAVRISKFQTSQHKETRLRPNVSIMSR